MMMESLSGEVIDADPRWCSPVLVRVASDLYGCDDSSTSERYGSSSGIEHNARTGETTSNSSNSVTRLDGARHSS